VVAGKTVIVGRRTTFAFIKKEELTSQSFKQVINEKTQNFKHEDLSLDFQAGAPYPSAPPMSAPTPATAPTCLPRHFFKTLSVRMFNLSKNSMHPDS
jgi:hypothetical protein